MQESHVSKPRKSPLLEQTRQLMRTRHMSIRTEEAYLRWIEQFLRFHKQARGAWVHPAEMSDPEINQFLTYLAVERKVAASTQNQAFSALLFLYQQVLKKEIKINAVRAKQPERMPVVLSMDEVRRVLVELPWGTSLFDELKPIVVATLGVHVSEVVPTARFIEDLGMG